MPLKDKREQTKNLFKPTLKERLAEVNLELELIYKFLNYFEVKEKLLIERRDRLINSIELENL